MRGAPGVRRAPQGPEWAAADDLRAELGGAADALRRAGAAVLGAARSTSARTRPRRPRRSRRCASSPRAGASTRRRSKKATWNTCSPRSSRRCAGGAAPKPPWVEMREARSTTCADKTFETHVGPFRQPASIHSPFPVRGRRPQLRAAAWPATAGALELRRTLRQSHALARDCMYVNADKMNGFGASDTSYGQVFEIAAPDLRRGGFRGPRRYC